MKIAFITTKPARLDSGSEVRNYHLLKALTQGKGITQIKVILVGEKVIKTDIRLNDPKISVTVLRLPARNIMKSAWAFLRGDIPYIAHLLNHDFQAAMKNELTDTDIMVLSELDGYFVVSKILEGLPASVKVILDCHNVDYYRFKSEIRFGSLAKQILGKLRLNRIQELEIEALKRVDIILACSNVDKTYFQKYVSSEVKVIPNGVEAMIGSFSHKTKINNLHPAILFMGQLSYPPNEDGLRFYLGKIHPMIRKKTPNARLTVIGKNPPKWLQKIANADKSIELLGFVEQTQDYIQQADVCICPLRAGSGTRLKILEYLLAAKPVVTTTIGCEGIDVKHKKHLLIADNPEEFADSIYTLLENEKLAKQLGADGQKLVKSKYDWQTIRQEFTEIVKEINKV